MEPAGWRYTTRGIAIRLFFTCWLVYSLHFATNIVREIYLSVAVGDHGSFRVDEYSQLHPDLFEKPGYGWHINNSPGASLIAAIPYALNRFWIDPVVEHVRTSRNQSGGASPPAYNSPWPMARDFYAEAWRRGLDIKLGLAAFVMHFFCMAPLSAAGVVAMFFALRKILGSNRAGFWLAVLYGFGTPIFFRTGYLNQNLMTAHIVFAGFLLLWNWGERISAEKLRLRFILAGVAGGLCVLLDYSGVVLLAILWLYGFFKHEESRLQNTAWYALGAMLPLGLLWFYQWKSFGHPFLPAQYHMPAINAYVETGFRGFVGPRPALLWSLLFDYRYGLLLSCPILVLSIFAFWTKKFSLPRLELRFLFLFFLGLWIFFSGVNYTNLQFNTGIRYLVAVVPFLFIPTAMVLRSIRSSFSILLSLIAIVQAWCMAMYRDVERGAGIAEPVLQVFLNGFQLPALTTISRMDSLREYFEYGPSPLVLFALAACMIYLIWRKRDL